MIFDEVKEGEERALNYRLEGTSRRFRKAFVTPKLKLTGLASNGNDRIAIVNGARLVAGQATELIIDGLSVPVHCLRVDEKTVVLSMPPDRREVVLRIGASPVVLP